MHNSFSNHSTVLADSASLELSTCGQSWNNDIRIYDSWLVLFIVDMPKKTPDTFFLVDVSQHLVERFVLVTYNKSSNLIDMNFHNMAKKIIRT